MPSGVALARSSVPSSRSTTSSCATPTSPVKARFMPSAPGKVLAPSEKSVPGTCAPRMKNSVTTRTPAGNR